MGLKTEARGREKVEVNVVIVVVVEEVVVRSGCSNEGGFEFTARRSRRRKENVHRIIFSHKKT